MFKLKKMLIVLLVICICVSSTSTDAFAGRPEDVLPGNKNTVLTVGEDCDTEETLCDNSVIFEKEEILETFYSGDAAASFGAVLNGEGYSKDGYDKLLMIENLFGCDLEISTAHRILDNVTGNDYIRYISKDRTEISFSADNGIFKISTIYNEITTTESEKVSTKEMQKACIDLMPDLYQLFSIKEDYALTETYDFDQDYLFFTFEKMLENGITNPFQSINVVFDKNTLKFSIAVKFDRAPNAVTPNISAADAISVANEYTAEEVMLDTAELTYVSDGTYNTKIYQCDDDICYLVYEVGSMDSNSVIYIDALSGKYVGGDLLMGETGFAVAISESKTEGAYNYNSNLVNYTDAQIGQFNAWRIQKRGWAASAMTRLGYSATTTSYSTSAMITDVRNYLQALSDEYAFYFSGHGSPTALGFKRNAWITPDDVRGNWHFVFLDACSTAADTRWANAFKINGYANRAYLGWSGSVTYGNTYLFAQEFWPLINGTKTVRQAAVDAAALVPGSGTTPIKFYGDTSYTGEAWS